MFNAKGFNLSSFRAVLDTRTVACMFVVMQGRLRIFKSYNLMHILSRVSDPLALQQMPWLSNSWQSLALSGRMRDVGKSKAEVAAERIMQRVHGVKVTPHFCRIEDKPAEWYQDFHIIVLGLDSLEVRGPLVLLSPQSDSN
jgi:hypothetical protein